MEHFDVELNYGWQNSHDTYETYHAFELTDPDEQADSGLIANTLANALDTSPDDDDFNWNSMYVRLPESLVKKIQLCFINEIMAGCGNPEKAHEMYKLWWMLIHGHTLTELMQELKEVQYFDPEDSDQISTPADELFLQWEEEYGFGGAMWPCLGEFLENEYREEMR